MFDVGQTSIEFGIEGRQFIEGGIKRTVSVTQYLTEEERSQWNINCQTLCTIDK